MQTLKARDGGSCFYCERDLSEVEAVHVDHVVPRVHGGSDAVDNLVLACSRCNMRKRSLPGWLFLVVEEFDNWDRLEYHEAYIQRPAFPFIMRDRLAEFRAFFGARVQSPAIGQAA